MQMSDEQRAQFTAQVEKQQAVGLVPQDVIVTQGGAQSAVGMPAYATEREDDGTIQGSAQTLGGVPTRLRHDSNLDQVTVECQGVRMRASDAERHGFLFRSKDGRLSFVDDMQRADAGAKATANTSPNQATPKADEVTPEAKAEAEGV